MAEVFIGWVVSLAVSFVILASVAQSISVFDFIAILCTIVAGAVAWIYAHS